MDNLTNNTTEVVNKLGFLSSLKTVLVLMLVSFLLGAGVCFYYAQKHYNAEIATINTELNDYKAKYSTIEQQREDAIIAKAKAEEKANKTIYLPGETKTVTQVEYVEKTSPKDVDAELNIKPAGYKYSYNGTEYEAKATTTEGKEIKDGKLVVTQTSSVDINVDDIVNRQIANTMLKKEKEIAVLKRQDKQDTFWGTVAGFAIGKYVSK